MSSLQSVLLLVHVVAGSVGLLALAPPLLAKKGSRVHVRSGWVFVAGMAGVSLTGIAISLGWILSPHGFGVPSSARGLPVAEALGVAASLGGFLMMIGLMTATSLHAGVAAVRRKTHASARPTLLGVVLPVATLASGAYAAITSIPRGDWLHVAFVPVAVSSAIGALAFLLRPLPTRMAWWYAHASMMTTAIIAAVTAFMVFGGSRFLGDLVAGPLVFVPWFLPTVIAVPILIRTIARARARFGEVPSTAPGRADTLRA